MVTTPEPPDGTNPDGSPQRVGVEVARVMVTEGVSLPEAMDRVEQRIKEREERNR